MAIKKVELWTNFRVEYSKGVSRPTFSFPFRHVNLRAISYRKVLPSVNNLLTWSINVCHECSVIRQQTSVLSSAAHCKTSPTCTTQNPSPIDSILHLNNLTFTRLCPSVTLVFFPLHARGDHKRGSVAPFRPQRHLAEVWNSWDACKRMAYPTSLIASRRLFASETQERARVHEHHWHTHVADCRRCSRPKFPTI